MIQKGFEMRKPINFDDRSRSLCVLAALVALEGCGPGSPPAPLVASSGQVRLAAASAMSMYAASRATDQVSFGATPALVADIRRAGLATWLDSQMALPVSAILTPNPYINYDLNDQLASQAAYNFAQESFFDRALNAPDQLRQRVAWSLFQYIPVNGKVQPYGMLEFYNVLMSSAFGNYRDLLRDITLQPSMGFFLDNISNRAVSEQCFGCAPNENYARELLQLFTLGVVQLGADGAVVRDANGKPKETYTQKDVENLARALTGWESVQRASGDTSSSNWANYGKNLVPAQWAPAHDRNAKTVMGTVFPAGREAPAELETILDMLMAHPNIAPFVSLRLIQHLVTSDPSPQYLGRVAAVFRNNGQGVAGDMKAVIRTILLDPEARAGDLPNGSAARFGKLREPVLHYTATLRGLGCTQPLRWQDGNRTGVLSPGNQIPLNPSSVFSYYLPTDRAPGSNLLAPEQKLLAANEITDRLSRLPWNLATEPQRALNVAAGCQVALLGQAFTKSPTAFIDIVSERWFRGAMPPTLRSNLLALAQSQNYGSADMTAMNLVQFALITPYFGAIQ